MKIAHPSILDPALAIPLTIVAVLVVSIAATPRAKPAPQQATETERAISSKWREVDDNVGELGDLLLRYHLETRAALAAAGQGPDVPDWTAWTTAIPEGLPDGANEGHPRMTWGEDFWYPGVTEPRLIPTDAPELHGTWYGYQHPTKDIEPTLWHANAYNVYGVIDGVDAWGLGDFENGREGHFLYVRSVPHLNMLISNCHAYCIGGQAIQREWREHETEIPRSVWEAAGGTFTVEDCTFLETGLIDHGMAPRASWALALYNTWQHTVVRRVRHVNFWSLPPHEGSLFVGYGQDGYRTPSLVVEDCYFWCRQGDRAIIFLQAVNEALITRTRLRGNAAYIDATDDCHTLTIQDMPQDTQVRIKHASQPFNAPYRFELVPAGETRVIDLIGVIWTPAASKCYAFAA